MPFIFFRTKTVSENKLLTMCKQIKQRNLSLDGTKIYVSNAYYCLHSLQNWNTTHSTICIDKDGHFFRGVLMNTSASPFKGVAARPDPI